LRLSGADTVTFKKLNLTLDGRHHSGIDDTRNIAKILLKMIADSHTNFQPIYLKK